jgi:hypothetical protein
LGKKEAGVVTARSAVMTMAVGKKEAGVSPMPS